MATNTSNGRFVNIPAEDIKRCLNDICEKVSEAGGVCSEGTSGKEVTFDIQPPGVKTFVRVFTSLGRGSSSVRGCGEDAVRLIVGFMGKDRRDRDRFFTVRKKTVYRTAPQNDDESVRVEAFLERFKEAIRGGYKIAKLHPHCPDCGAPMAIRENRATKHEFLGCSKYPQCKKTIPLPKES